MNRREQAKKKKQKSREKRLRQEKLRPQASSTSAIEGAKRVSADEYDPFEATIPSQFQLERSLRSHARSVASSQSSGAEGDREYLPEDLMRVASLPNEGIDVSDESIDPAERAQELAYQAREAQRPAQGISLARAALELDPECVDALVYVAQLASASDAERVAGLLWAVEVGARVLGGDTFFQESRGHFWGLVMTRPYMRARSSLASALHDTGRLHEASGHFEAMLELNPGDNQGVRFSLLGLYLELNDLVGAQRLLEAHADDYLAFFPWARALERWLSGDRMSAARCVRAGRLCNAFVHDTLLGLRSPRPSRHGWRPGEESEAAEVYERLGRAWRAHAPALEWLRNGASVTTASERAEAVRSYGSPVADLLGSGIVEQEAWDDYVDKFHLTTEHATELLRMATDVALHECENDSRPVWAPLHAWRALAQLKYEPAAAPLVELLRVADDAWMKTDMPRVFSAMGQAAVEPLRALLTNSTANTYARWCAVDCLAEIAQRHPELRDTCAGFLRGELERFETNDPELNAALVSVISAKLHDASALSWIERAFEAERVDEQIAGALEHVREALLKA